MYRGMHGHRDQFIGRDEMIEIFSQDARYLGDGMYSIWAPGGNVYSDDTAKLLQKFLARFDKNDEGLYDLDTVRNEE